ncbi:hypothetical protein EJ07DRAFT_182140 [Lizonia empirigonia]|nr:hypothetical protein EJ07DRAFT_182140 [Lizonia empirigonia]
MRHFISHIGLKFYLFELQGTPTYEYTKAGRPAKQYEISEKDLEDAGSSEAGDSETTPALKVGLDASAVGICVRLTKNDGLLQMKFEGREGRTAEWTFHGLKETSHRKMTVSSSTQTHVDAGKCVLCGNEGPKQSVSRDCASQTEVVTIHSVASRVRAMQAKDATVPFVKPEARTKTAFSPTSTRADSCQTKGVASTEPKRKASSTRHSEAPLHKRAKSKHDSQPCPSVIYMECQRFHPVRKGNVGRLMVSIEEGTVWYEDTHGQPFARTMERRQVDLRIVKTKVTYQAMPTASEVAAHDGATHVLSIKRPTKGATSTTLASFYCAAPKWKTWYRVEGQSSTDRYPTDAEVVVGGTVHCIDRSSGRKAEAERDWEQKAGETAGQ